MATLTGQAWRIGLARSGGTLVRLGRIVVALTLLLGVVLAALTWRLAHRPIELPWLAERIGRMASTPDRAVSVAHLLVSWGGFDRPGSAPLQIRLRGVAASGSFGDIRIETADVALDLYPLLGGHVAPDAAEITGLRARLNQAPASRGDSPDIAATLRSLAGANPDAPWARLRHVHVHDGSAEMAGMPGRVARFGIDLDRLDAGGLTGAASADLRAADQTATLSLTAQVAQNGRETAIQAALTPIAPAALAGMFPQAAALDAPVTLAAAASLGPDLAWRHAELSVSIGAGTIHAGTGTAPLRAAEAHLAATPDAVDFTLTRLDTAVSATAMPTRFTGHARGLAAGAAGWKIAAALDVDQIDVADLPALWPEGVGGPGTRPWMTRNITAGRMTGGHVDMDATVPPDASDISLTRIAGHLDGHDLTVHWLRPVPPIEHAEAHLTVADPDIIDIAVSSAVQSGGSFGGMQYRAATIHLTGIAGREQYAEIRTGLAGPLPDLLAVLNHPRVRLLAKRPVPMHDPSGDVTAQVHVGRLPLRDNVSMDDLVIDTTAHVARTHLGGLIAGHDLDGGSLDLSANNDGLSVTGTATLAGFPSRLKIGMDFRDGQPAQIQETADIHSEIAIKNLATFGIDPGDRAGGALALDTRLRARRDGRTEIDLTADLTDVTLSEPRAGVTKANGEPGSGHAEIVLEHDKLAAIEALRVEAPGLHIEGTADIEAGQPVGLRLTTLRLGSGTDVAGAVRFSGASHAIGLHLSGPSLDISPLLAPSKTSTSGSTGMGGQPWSADVAVDRLILGPDRRADAVRVTATSDGEILRTASVSGRLPGRGGGSLRATITPDAGGRRLSVSVEDTGAWLRAADVTDALIGGDLRITGRWSSLSPRAPLAGVAEMEDFRIRDAPAIGRVLQALTVYGLVELARGPGLGLTKLVAPFGFEDKVLTLHDARATSPSLGFTAQGRIDLRRRTADLSGTVVPAYFFNSLLGRVPVVGPLFTAEKGGGLFAASVAVTGPLDDLSVRVNPLSALTPGFLRGLFGPEAAK